MFKFRGQEEQIETLLLGLLSTTNLLCVLVIIDKHDSLDVLWVLVSA